MNRLHRWYCQSGQWKQKLENEILPWSLSGVDLGGEVLEVGPGPGLTTDWLRRQTKTITSIEVDPKLADTLNRRLAGTNASVQCGDATAMPFGDRTFSGAVAFTMLHHVPSGIAGSSVRGGVPRAQTGWHFRWNGQHAFFPDADISHPGHTRSRGS